MVDGSPPCNRLTATSVSATGAVTGTEGDPLTLSPSLPFCQSQPQPELQSEFAKFYSKCKNRPHPSQISFPILGIDPGETSGMCVFRSLDDWTSWQMPVDTMREAVQNLHKLFHELQPKAVVAESYHIYSWKIKEHTWSTLFTPRLIGVLECLCTMYNIPLKLQSAQVGKGFMTDDRLKSFGLYVTGQRHARDALRHTAQYLLFSDLVTGEYE